MHRIRLDSETDFAGWRAAARRLILSGARPEDVVWDTGEGELDLFAGSETQAPPGRAPLAGSISVPKAFIETAERVVCHRAPERFARLYQLLWDVQTNRAAMGDPLNPAAQWVREADKVIRRDLHKMHAFVRFRKVGERAGREVFSAWFEPDHHIIELAAPFFMRRFTGMDWTILTPHGCAAWDGERLTFAEGVDRSKAPPADVIEDQWRTYYASIFNPARLKVQAMLSEMPAKYWKNLPEAELIPGLIRSASGREQGLLSEPASHENVRTSRMSHFLPGEQPVEITSLTRARKAAETCERCPLHECATQTVFGEGSVKSTLMIVGEQPGDQEDLAGHPFVGPAGNMLDKGLGEAGIARKKVYVTNAVKHFKFTPRGKRRMHQKPNAGEIDSCRFWLDLERKFVAPKLIVTLGTTALRGVLGKAVPLKEVRGGIVALEGESRLIATVHPSYLLRLPDRERAGLEYRRFVEDLKRAAALDAGGSSAAS